MTSMSFPLLRHAGKIVWYENSDGAGSFQSEAQLITADHGDYSYFFLGPWAIAMADLDRDGDLDVVSPGLNHTAWYENRLAGDADDDGEVAFADFVTLAENFGRTDACVGRWRLRWRWR